MRGVDQEEVETIISDLENAAEILYFVRSQLEELQPAHGQVGLKRKISRGVALSESIVRRALEPIDYR